jgi:hypothetical protein
MTELVLHDNGDTTLHPKNVRDDIVGSHTITNEIHWREVSIHSEAPICFYRNASAFSLSRKARWCLTCRAWP